MVKIIDGMIVDDDDPRAKEWERRHKNQSATTNSTTNSTTGGGRTLHSQAQPPNTGFNPLQGFLGNGAGRQGNPGESPFQQINGRLASLGIPTWHLAGREVEPLVTVALVLGLVFYGLQGVMIVGLLWFIFNRYFHGHCSQEIKDIMPELLKRTRITRDASETTPSFTDTSMDVAPKKSRI